jgi:hypothetical protein
VANVAELEPKCADEAKGTIWPIAFGLVRTWHTLSFNTTPGARDREGITIRHFGSSRRVLLLVLRSGNRNSG